VHNVGQWPNLRHLGEPLGGAEGLLEVVSRATTLGKLFTPNVPLFTKQ